MVQIAGEGGPRCHPRRAPGNASPPAPRKPRRSQFRQRMAHARVLCAAIGASRACDARTASNDAIDRAGCRLSALVAYLLVTVPSVRQQWQQQPQQQREREPSRAVLSSPTRRDGNASAAVPDAARRYRAARLVGCGERRSAVVPTALIEGRRQLSRWTGWTRSSALGVGEIT
eukprot:361902-Chlamydomonas_euryale.AAC.9